MHDVISVQVNHIINIIFSYPICGDNHGIIQFCEVEVCSVQFRRKLGNISVMAVQLKKGKVQ